MFLSSLGLLALATSSHASSQSVLDVEQPAADLYDHSPYAAPYNDGPFTPADLSALSVDDFITLSHPSLPDYGVRMKKTVFECDTSSNVYTGYIDIDTRHLFYYFIESRNDPGTDDVILWINGGPGCVSSMGLFMENGPCKILDAGGPKYNPYSWTTNANVFYVDQPVGVGYSYDDKGPVVNSTEQAGKDISAFLVIFFENFYEFKGRAFHMAGESYAGHYLPIFAAQVYDQNAELVAAGRTAINLQSVMIGNGLVDYFTMSPSYIDVQCTTASISPPISNISTCVQMKQALPRCQQWTIGSCIKQFDASDCSAARDYCDTELELPYLNSGLNPYDITKECEGDDSVHCYPVMQYMIDYLSSPATRELLGVSPSVPPGFVACNDTINEAFTQTLDEYHETYIYLGQLLERSVRVLVYVGTYDWICNWIGNERWTLKMPWSGQDAFVSQPLTDWQINGHAVGKTRSANGLTYATVAEAGHMVPFDKPEEALVLVQRWLAKEPI